MCFSPTASFTAGIILTAIGIATLKKTRNRTEVPLAVIPLLFGIQQIIEGIIWLSFKYPNLLLNEVMTYIYSFFSHILWPVLIPFSVALIEPVPLRKKLELFYGFLGIAVALYLLYFIVKFPVTSHVVNNSIAYHSPHFYTFIVIGIYLLATGGSCLLSSHRFVFIFGIFLILFLGITYYFYASTFFSVWCFFSAILSLIIYLHLDRADANFLNPGAV